MLGEAVRDGAGNILLRAGAGSADPATRGVAVTPDDDDEITIPVRGVWVGTGGNLAVSLSNQTVILKNVPDGTLVPISPTQILATGTTASDIVALG